MKHDREPVRSGGRVRATALCGLLALAALPGCTQPTAYAPAAPGATPGGSYGYTEEKIDPRTWRVRFAGNSATSRERVDSMLLYRAAELATAQNARSFVVLDKNIERDTSYRGTGYPTLPFGAYRPGFGFGRPLPYRHGFYTGFGYGFPYAGPANLQPVNRYTGHATLRLFPGAAPEGLGVPYDAAEVLKTIGPTIESGEGSGAPGSAIQP